MISSFWKVRTINGPILREVLDNLGLLRRPFYFKDDHVEWWGGTSDEQLALTNYLWGGRDKPATVVKRGDLMIGVLVHTFGEYLVSVPGVLLEIEQHIYLGAHVSGITYLFHQRPIGLCFDWEQIASQFDMLPRM